MDATELLHHADIGTFRPDDARATLPASLDGAAALTLEVRALREARCSGRCRSL